MAVTTPKRKPSKRKGKASDKVWTPDAIRAMRKRLNLTLEEAAARVGVTARTFLAWELESQEREPSASHKILLSLLDSGKL